MEWFLPLVFLLPLVLLSVINASSNRTITERQSRQLAVLERKVDLIMTHLGISLPPPDVPDGSRARSGQP